MVFQTNLLGKLVEPRDGFYFWWLTVEGERLVELDQLDLLTKDHCDPTRAYVVAVYLVTNDLDGDEGMLTTTSVCCLVCAISGLHAGEMKEVPATALRVHL